MDVRDNSTPAQGPAFHRPVLPSFRPDDIDRALNQPLEPPLYNIPMEEREAVMNHAMYKILEAEKNEEKRRRKMQKISAMVSAQLRESCWWLIYSVAISLATTIS